MKKLLLVLCVFCFFGCEKEYYTLEEYRLMKKGIIEADSIKQANDTTGVTFEITVPDFFTEIVEIQVP
jgi:hypothetical protein